MTEMSAPDSGPVMLEDSDADVVEKAMGDLLDKVQEQTDFPVDQPGTKPSATMTYDVAGELSVAIHSKWILFTGFELTDITLGIAVSKRTRSRAAMRVSLEAQMLLGDTSITLKGWIPRLEEGKDIDFVLSVKTTQALQSIPLDTFLTTSSSGAIQFGSVRDAIEKDIAEQIFVSGPGGFAASATLTITRLAATKTYQVKSFEAAILGDFDWDMIPDKLRLRQASLAVVARRETPTHSLDWNLRLAGSLLVQGTIPVSITGQFEIQNGACTGLSASVAVGSLRGVTLPELLDAVAGHGAASEAQKDYNPPPSLYIPTGSTSPSLRLSAALIRSPSGWILSKAEATLVLQDLAWSPFEGIKVESILFRLVVQRQEGAGDLRVHGPVLATGPSQLTAGPSQPGQLLYAAYLRGLLWFMGLPLATEIIYDPAQKTLAMEATVADDTICSLQNLCSNLSEKIAPAQNKGPNPKYDIAPIVDGAIVPTGCPVSPVWALQGNFASERKCSLLIADSSLVRVSFTASYQGSPFTWQLSEGLGIVNAGVFLNADFQPPASTSDPSILAFIYGRIKLAKGTTLFGFVACSKTSDRSRFDVLLTVQRQPDEGLGLEPRDVMDDTTLVGQPIDTSGWVLPTTAPQDSSVVKTATSFNATVKASFVSSNAGKPTALTAVAASLRGSSPWRVMSGLELQDFALGIIARRQGLDTAAPFQLWIALYGRAEATVGGVGFDVWCLAVLDRGDHSSDFRAIVTACPAGTAQEPPQVSQLSPAQLTQLDYFGHFDLAVPPDQQPPDACPANVDKLINSASASCELHIYRHSDVEGWILAELVFRLAFSGSWAVVPAKVVLNVASLTVAVANPKAAAQRTVTAVLAASITLGTSISLEASLTFSRSQGRVIMSGNVTTAQAAAVDVAQMAKELYPPQTGDVIPTGSTNINLLTTASIGFWLDAAQPTLLLAGSTGSGSLLYFLQRPDVQKDEYVWLLSMSITGVTQVFPWLDASVTGAFSLASVGIEMINQTLTVSALVSYLTLTGVIEPQQLSPLALLRGLDQAATLDAGAWVFAVVNLGGGGSMAGTLGLALSPTAAVPQITLYAQVSAGVSSMVCELRLANFSIWGGSLMLDGTVTYKPSVPSIGGTVTLTLTDLSPSVKPQVRASVLMTEAETEFSASLSAGEQVDIENPFGAMYNTGLLVVQVAGTFTKPTQTGQPPGSKVVISGSLRLGSATSTWSVVAKVLFVDGKARVAVGTIGTTDTAAISNALLSSPPPTSVVPKAPKEAQGSGPAALQLVALAQGPAVPQPAAQGSWPADLPVFSFQSASIYYARSIQPNEKPLVIDGVTYQFGYCISATLTLFGANFVITAWLPQDQSGLNISGSYEAVIDLVFVQLCGYVFESKTLPWPSVEINSTTKQQIYTVKTGLVLFGIQGYDISLSYESASQRLRGTFTYNGSLLGVDSPSISIAYQNGFMYIDNWPFKKDGEEDRTDFLQEAIREASTIVEKDCGDLVKLVLDKLIQTEFDVSLGKPSGGRNPVSGKTYIGTVQWSYVVYVTVPPLPKQEIGRLNMTPIDLTIDQGFTVNSIGKSLLKLIADNIVNVGSALLSDPAKFAALIGLMSMKGAATEVLKSLLCRDVDEENVKEEAQDRLTENKDEPDTRASEVEDAFNAVDGAASFEAAVGSFASGVAAFAGYLGLGILFGAVGSLATNLIPFLTNPSVISAIKGWMDTYHRLLGQCQDSQTGANQYLVTTASPSAPPVTSWSVDTPTAAAILVDWSNSLPKPPPNAPADYFGDFSEFRWQVAYGYVDNPQGSGITILDPTSNKSLTITDPAFLQQRNVYVWVRSFFTLQGTPTNSNWSQASPITHPLFLPAPKGISVGITNAPAYDQVTITIADPKKTLYLVAFADDEQGTGSPAYQTNITDGSATSTVPVLAFSPAAGDQGPLKGFIRELTTNPALWRDSPWTASASGLQVVQPDLGFTVQQVVVSDALLQWNSLGTAPSAFTYIATKQDGSIVNTTVVKQTSGTQIQTQLSSPDFASGATISFALRQNPTSPNILQVFAKQSLLFRAALVISEASFFDAEAQTLELYVNSIVALSAGQAATVTLFWSQGTPQTVTSTVEFSDATTLLAKLTAVTSPTPPPTSISVSVTVDPGQTVLQSPPWAFPDPASAPFAANFHVHFADGVLNVYWDVINPVVSCRVDLVALNLNPLVQGQDLPDSLYKGHYSTSLSGSDLDVFKNDNMARIQVWCTSQQGVAYKSKENISWLPDLTLWTTPAAATNTATAAALSSLTNMTTVSGSLGVVWWMGGDLGSIQGSAQTDTSDDWASIGASTSLTGTTPLTGGSCVASLSRSPDHQEVFWIKQGGGIDGVWRVGGSNFLPPTDYTFDNDGTAATAQGGSLTAASCAPDTMDLWYVTPAGQVQAAHWDGGSGWANPFTVSSQANGGDTSMSVLAACVTGVAAAELFWIQQTSSGGSTQWLIQNLRCSDTAASPPPCVGQVVTDSGSPAPNSAPLAVYSATKGTLVAWITTMGAVQMAVRQAVAGGGPPTWCLAWTVGPPQTASPQSRICAGFWDGVAPLPALYWVGEDGAVTVAEWDSLTTPAGARLQLDYWASYKHSANAGWRPGPNPLAEIAACSGSAGLVRLFWIAADSTIWTMRYPKTGAKPWPS